MQYVIICDDVILCTCSNINTAKNKIDSMVRARLQLLREKHPKHTFGLKTIEDNECIKTIIFRNVCLRYNMTESIYKIYEVPQF